MASSITNYSSFININFPVPGEDNDSQVFRDNFYKIQSSLNIAGQEISNLQLTSVLTSKENNFNDNIIKSAKFQDCSLKVDDQTDVIQTGGIKIDYRDGSYQRLIVNSGTTIISILNWPGPEASGSLTLEIQSISLFSTYVAFSDSNVIASGTGNQPYKLFELNKEIFNVWSNGQTGYTFVNHVSGSNMFSKNIFVAPNKYISFEDNTVFVGDVTTSTLASNIGNIKAAIGKVDIDQEGSYYGVGSKSTDLWIASTNQVYLGKIGGYPKIKIDGLSMSPTLDNVASLGTSSFKYTAVWATNGTIQTSDLRNKDNVMDSTLGLGFIKDLNPKSFNYKNESLTRHGLIAQDVKTVIDKHNAQFAGWIEGDDENKTQHLIYSEFIAPLINSIKEITNEIENIKKHLGL